MKVWGIAFMFYQNYYNYGAQQNLPSICTSKNTDGD